MTELELALSVDDELYAKFEYLNRELQKRAARFNARRMIREVRRRAFAPTLDIQMKILEVHDTGEGLVIIVE